MRTVVLVDGEHYPPGDPLGHRDRRALAATRSSGRCSSAASEKIDPAIDPRRRRADPRRRPRSHGVARPRRSTSGVPRSCSISRTSRYSGTGSAWSSRRSRSHEASAMRGRTSSSCPRSTGPPLAGADARRDRYGQAHREDGDQRRGGASRGTPGRRPGRGGDGPRRSGRAAGRRGGKRASASPGRARPRGAARGLRLPGGRADDRRDHDRGPAGGRRARRGAVRDQRARGGRARRRAGARA